MSTYGPRNPSNFEKRPPKPTMHPRKVVGGIKLSYRPPADVAGLVTDGSAVQDAQIIKAIGHALDQTGHDTAVHATDADPRSAVGWSWVAARWMRLAEDHAPGEQLVEGLEYARLGQTRSIEIKAGLIGARVQGRIPTAYRTEIRLPVFSHEQWAGVVSAMTSQAKYGASLLAGELPNNIEDLFAPAGLRLLPADEQDLATSCTCDIFRGKDALTGMPRPGGATRWCKHVCCLMYLIAEKLAKNPLMAFSLRGLDDQELLEQLRQHRALAGLARVGGGAAPVYAQHVTPRPELAKPLEEVVRERGAAGFWSADELAATALTELELPIQQPTVTHPLLRRLGPSPFKEAKFPLVGLLATCYDVAGAAALENVDSAPMPQSKSAESI